MKNIILIMILAASLVFSSGCSQMIDAIVENEKVTQSDIALATVAPEITSESYSGTYKNTPQLPNIDFSQMDLFEDGYQIVDFDHAPDGDTAIFIVGDSYLKTRFLGVDTKEMSTDSGIPELWAQQAKEFTNYMLINADEIILELDNNSDVFDAYDRLLAWIWVDGQLLNYMLAESGYADVKYLYDDYKYNDYLLDAEYHAQNEDRGIWGDDEPYFDPNDLTLSDIAKDGIISISQARDMPDGSKVQIHGTVTSKIGNNVFLQDDTAGIYIYAGSKSYSALTVGNQISIEGTITDYNGLLEIADINESDIKIISSHNEIPPMLITLAQVGEKMESQLVKVENAKITFVDYKSDEKGYTIFIEQNGAIGEVRIDKYLKSYPSPESLIIGSYIDIVGNVAQHYDSYQIMISSERDITTN
ncbi:MAG: thermonuclease family protein [Eubacteriales bacterium]